MKQSRGFTLVELIISMALFLVLSTALIALLTQAFGFLSTGSAGSEVTDKGTDFLRPLRADLENVVAERSLTPGPSRIRFLCDEMPIDSDKDGNVDMFVQRLAFVRSTREEIADPITRMAGTKPGAKEYIDGDQDRQQAESGELKAAGGMMEVLYAAIPDDPKNPGVLTLYRGIRAPIGGAGSLTDPKSIRTPEDIRKVAQPLLTGVLYLGFEFAPPDSEKADALGAVTTWDSTRGLLEPGVGPTKFPFSRGPESLEDPRDDISPRSLVVTFVFERTGKENESGSLTADLSESARSAEVDSTVFANTSAEDYIKVSTEWMAFANRSAYEFSGMTRGQRNTVARPHKAGAVVRTGYTVRRTITIPAYREDYNAGLR